MNKVRAGASNSLQYLIWLKSKTVKIYSVVQSVKLLLALSMYRHILGIPMGTHCTSHVADLFVFCYKRDFMLCLSVSNQEDILKLLTVPPDI